ncbi:hypothetical protein [Staphylococcus phage vB_StaM_PB50]|nr:hypothetical protein [Staphylococcus phage vB_StaM_PB50]
MSKKINKTDLNEEDMFLYEGNDLDSNDEELKRDIPEDEEEIEETFNKLINEEEIDDEESDDLDEVEDAEEEDDVKVIDSDDPEYDDPIILDKDDVVDDDTANNDIQENLLFNEDDKEDEEKTQPGYTELRAKFLDSQMVVPTTFGPHSTYGVNTSSANTSAPSVSDGGMSTANGTASVGGAVTETYLYNKDPKPEFTFVDLKNALLDTDAEVGYTIGTPESSEVKNQSKNIVANEAYVDEENKAFPFVKVNENYDTAIVKAFNGEVKKISESILNTFKLESKSRKQIFVTNESIETMRGLLNETGKIKNGQQICEDCGSKLSLNESNELICENCNKDINEAIKQEKEVGEVICNECGVQEEVDPNVNEAELVCENCGSDDVEFKTKVINEFETNEEFSPKDLLRYATTISESLGKRVDIVVSKESYSQIPSVYDPSSLLVDKVDFGKGFKKVIVVAPKGNKLLKELYTSNEIDFDSLKEEFNSQLIQRVTNESLNGILENFLNPLDEVDHSVKEELNNNEVDLEQLEESINAEMKNKDEVLYEGHQESLEEFYEDIVFEAYENVPNKDEEKFKKALSENINDLNINKEIKVSESSLIINGKTIDFEDKSEKELKEMLMNESRLEQNLLNENIFKIING